MNNKKGLMCLLIVFVITTMALGGYIIYDKVLKKENNTTPVRTNDEAKENKSNLVTKLNDKKDWVYEANYEKNINGESYTTNYNQTYYAKDIIVPFLNIDSKYANDSNQEIKEIFDSAIEKYNDGVKDLLTFVTCDYEKNINNNMASVLLTYTTGATDIVQQSYYTYNIDLKNGNKLSYEDTYKLVGLNSNTINSKVEEAISKTMKEKMKDFPNENYEEGTNFDTYNKKSIENYQNSVKNNSIKYFLDENNKLNIVVTLNIPVGLEEFATIIPVE